MYFPTNDGYLLVPDPKCKNEVNCFFVTISHNKMELIAMCSPTLRRAMSVGEQQNLYVPPNYHSQGAERKKICSV